MINEETTGLSEDGDVATDSDSRKPRKDRRQKSIPVAVERRSGKDRRADKLKEEGDKPSRHEGERRTRVDPTTCEKDYTDDEIAFMQAMDQYKRSNRRPFPTWSEVLEVLLSLGYRKTEKATALPGLPTVKRVREE